jgi:hypothetical protein
MESPEINLLRTAAMLVRPHLSLRGLPAFAFLAKLLNLSSN